MPKNSLNLFWSQSQFLGAKFQSKIWQPQVKNPPPQKNLESENGYVTNVKSQVMNVNPQACEKCEGVGKSSW